MATKGIAFNAYLNSLKTTIDGGWRLTFDVSQDQAKEILELSKYRDNLLTIACIPTTTSNATTEEQHDGDDTST